MSSEVVEEHPLSGNSSDTTTDTSVVRQRGAAIAADNANSNQGIRFNGHIRRMKSFVRRAALINWIEPTSFFLALVACYVLYMRDVVTNYVLLLICMYLFNQLVIVAFSICVIITQAQPTRDLTNIRTKVVDEDVRKRQSRCGSFRPPQVVRWDILGVTLSNWFGKVNSIPLPVFMRVPLFKLYASKYGVNLDEIKLPLSSFRNLQEFFSRELKPGMRPIADTMLVSPVDAKITVFGPVLSEQVEQVKGVTYFLPSFLGEDTWQKISGKNLYHCVLYLAPGDYHRIHSAAKCDVTTLRHFPGTLFPISPVVARLVPNLFALNERVVLAGDWEHGFFSSTAVGAYHVGSMAFNFDKNVRTNRLRRDFTNPNLAYLSNKELGAHAYEFTYPPGAIAFEKGDEVGTFKLGSTIVLVFEVPEGKTFKFAVEPEQKIRMGEPLGYFE